MSVQSDRFAKRFWIGVLFVCLLGVGVAMWWTYTLGWKPRDMFLSGVFAALFVLSWLGFIFLILEEVGIDLNPIRFDLPGFAKQTFGKWKSRMLSSGKEVKA